MSEGLSKKWLQLRLDRSRTSGDGRGQLGADRQERFWLDSDEGWGITRQGVAPHRRALQLRSLTSDDYQCGGGGIHGSILRTLFSRVAIVCAAKSGLLGHGYLDRVDTVVGLRF